MKKVITALLCFSLLVSNSVFSFAETAPVQDDSITFQELTQLSEEFNFTPAIVANTKDIPTESILKNLSKEELEQLIITTQANIKPLVFEEDINIEPSSLEYTGTNLQTFSLDHADFNMNRNTYSTMALGWQTVSKTTTLSRTYNFGQVSDFQLYASVAANYSYEACTIPGETYKKRNYKFNSCDSGNITHLNRGAIEIKSVTSSTTMSSDLITQTYSGIYNQGIFVDIKGIAVRLPLADNTFNGTINYSISGVQ